MRFVFQLGKWYRGMRTVQVIFQMYGIYNARANPERNFGEAVSEKITIKLEKLSHLLTMKNLI